MRRRRIKKGSEEHEERETKKTTQQQRGRRRQEPHSFRDGFRMFIWGNVLITQCAPDQAEGQREADEGPVPVVVLPNGGHAHEDEDQGLADTAQHLHEILDGRVGCLGHVFFHVFFHCHCAGCDSAKGTVSERSTRFGPSWKNPPYW